MALQMSKDLIYGDFEDGLLPEQVIENRKLNRDDVYGCWGYFNSNRYIPNKLRKNKEIPDNTNNYVFDVNNLEKDLIKTIETIINAQEYVQKLSSQLSELDKCQQTLLHIIEGKPNLSVNTKVKLFDYVKEVRIRRRRCKQVTAQLQVFLQLCDALKNVNPNTVKEKLISNSTKYKQQTSDYENLKLPKENDFDVCKDIMKDVKSMF